MSRQLVTGGNVCDNSSWRCCGAEARSNWNLEAVKRIEFMACRLKSSVRLHGNRSRDRALVEISNGCGRAQVRHVIMASLQG